MGDPSVHLWLAQSNKRAGVVRQVAAESSRKQPEADASRRKQTQADASRAPPRTARSARGACMHGYHTTHKTPLWRFERQQWRSPTCSLPTQLACLLLTIASVCYSCTQAHPSDAVDGQVSRPRAQPDRTVDSHASRALGSPAVPTSGIPAAPMIQIPYGGMHACLLTQCKPTSWCMSQADTTAKEKEMGAILVLKQSRDVDGDRVPITREQMAVVYAQQVVEYGMRITPAMARSRGLSP